MRVSESTQGNYHKTSHSTVCNARFFFFVSCYACYPGKLLYEQTAMNFSTFTFSNDRNNLIIFSFGRGKQFDELTSNSKNIHWFAIWCVTEKRKLSCVWSSISWLNHNGNFYFLLLIAFPSKPTLLNEVQARELEQLKDKNINFTQLMFTSNPLSLWQELSN